MNPTTLLGKLNQSISAHGGSLPLTYDATGVQSVQTLISPATLSVQSASATAGAQSVIVTGNAQVVPWLGGSASGSSGSLIPSGASMPVTLFFYFPSASGGSPGFGSSSSSGNGVEPYFFMIWQPAATWRITDSFPELVYDVFDQTPASSSSSGNGAAGRSFLSEFQLGDTLLVLSSEKIDSDLAAIFSDLSGDPTLKGLLTATYSLQPLTVGMNLLTKVRGLGDNPAFSQFTWFLDIITGIHLILSGSIDLRGSVDAVKLMINIIGQPSSGSSSGSPNSYRLFNGPLYIEQLSLKMISSLVAQPATPVRNEVLSAMILQGAFDLKSGGSNILELDLAAQVPFSGAPAWYFIAQFDAGSKPQLKNGLNSLDVFQPGMDPGSALPSKPYVETRFPSTSGSLAVGGFAFLISDKKLVSFFASVEIQPHWNMVDLHKIGTISLDEFDLTFSGSRSLSQDSSSSGGTSSSFNLTANVSADITVFGALFRGTLTTPDYHLTLGLKQGPLDLTTVMRQMGFQFNYTPAPGQSSSSGASGFAITEFNIDAQLKTKEFSFDLAIDSSLQVGHFILEGLSLTTQYTKNAGLGSSSGSSAQLIGAIAGTIAIELPVTGSSSSPGDYLFVYLSATFDSATKHLTFDGETLPGQRIPVGLLIEALARKLKIDSKFPAALESFYVTQFKLTYDSELKAFTFLTDFELTAKDTLIKGEIQFQEKDGAFDFKGTIQINRLEFELAFEKDSSGQFLVASFYKDGGEKIYLRSLIAAITNDHNVLDKVPDLSLDVEDAVFAWAKSPDNKFLLGIDLATDLSLSELPLVGSKLPPEINAAVKNLQVAAASQTFTVSDVQIVNSLLPDGAPPLPTPSASQSNPKTSPGTLIKGLNIGALLSFGTTETLYTYQFPIGATSSSSAVGGYLPQRQGLAARQWLDTTGSNPAPPSPNLSNTKWFNINKTLGPINFQKVGVLFQGKELWFLMDAEFSLGGLSIEVQGLGLGSEISKFDPTFTISGLGIDYQNGAVMIAGELLKNTSTPGVKYEFDGAAVVKATDITIAAIGSYAKLGTGDTSLFIYAELDYPIGGPAFFFITGLALGFGYNRKFVPPALDQIANFPLIQEAMNPSQSPLPTNPNDILTRLTAELNSLETYIPPSVGENFITVGIKFTSFDIINSFALLTISFGNLLRFDILGLSNVTAPPDDNKSPLANLTVGLEATFIPEEGILRLEAEVQPGSYILSQNAHLTGGFAFYAWFKDPPAGSATGDNYHAGDFVFTIGGYHPDFTVPNYYPTIPRLGLVWQITSELSITATSYFALVPHALMAGINMAAVWDHGWLKAWFKAGADFLIAWKPYHYEASVYISIGVQATIHFFGTHHITVELGAGLDIWGPDFGGTAHIHFWIIGITISFGSQSPAVPPIPWPEFKGSFLNGGNNIASVRITDGLVKTGTDKQTNKTIEVVNRKELLLVTNCVVPSTEYTIKKDTTTVSNGPSPVAGEIGIGAMGLTDGSIKSSHTVTITSPTNSDLSNFKFETIEKNIPLGLWKGAEAAGLALKPDLNGASILEGALAGIKIYAESPKADQTLPIKKANLAYETHLMSNTWSYEPAFPVLTPKHPVPEDGIKQYIVNSVKTNPVRKSIIQDLGFDSSDVNLSRLTARQGFLLNPEII